MTDNPPLALVTGASRGIGYELAKQFADHGFDVMVNSEDAAISDAAETLRASGREVTPLRADLTVQDGVERLYAAVAATGRPVAAAALNAGIGVGGSFLDNDLADELRLIDLNVKSTVHLAKRLLPAMVRQGEGGILFTSSIASTMPGSFQAVYNASKSFIQSFAEALHNELKDTDVVVTSLMPGPTDTDFFRRAGMQNTRIGRMNKDDPALVARQGFDALMAGRTKRVAGSVKTRAQGLANAFLPDGAKAQLHRRMAEPDARSGDEQ
ncbi:SDR family NAD(P)-dependent oxidoreductase [Streptomyces sp. ICBB 8177]|uniref:SDR family NAD(P)-dependent oxidoreductase n=1 Tax=Streptomyces sp. ICBB 8177 TaxID=563922 RepID=UPI000D675FE9|nr:SDR family NAD(P)-dependent oxidoreductase [Streptomyces sp. ICBB 8177]PWI42929.1 oxidoreductase [Streptomyces sp. ICBB 8177]